MATLERHSQDYLAYCKSEHWVKLKRQCFEVHGDRCLWCGGIATTMHHRRYTRLKSPDEIHDVAPVCGVCHEHPADTERIIETAARAWRRRTVAWIMHRQRSWEFEIHEYIEARERLVRYARGRGDESVVPKIVREFSNDVTILALGDPAVQHRISRHALELEHEDLRDEYLEHLATAYRRGRKVKSQRRTRPSQIRCPKCRKYNERNGRLCWACELRDGHGTT